MIAAPHASDVMAAVFRAAFGPAGEAPEDFGALLARLDRCEPGKH
jgi:hypothetical protein